MPGASRARRRILEGREDRRRVRVLGGWDHSPSGALLQLRKTIGAACPIAPDIKRLGHHGRLLAAGESSGREGCLVALPEVPVGYELLSVRWGESLLKETKASTVLRQTPPAPIAVPTMPSPKASSTGSHVAIQAPGTTAYPSWPQRYLLFDDTGASDRATSYIPDEELASASLFSSGSIGPLPQPLPTRPAAMGQCLRGILQTRNERLRVGKEQRRVHFAEGTGA
ncbi:hypothetical protein C7999DRAFT_36496 [Corynascus novoguineensis]|uniref:Uncharacterized protein n=1 Tax=Corynascus novoguineensis TaxID=1126955 RepID=A0AAN7CJD3_9PEZI|nr:hypothetical protein C7999DRAFT_36496 [Corynascus novoguineensis]